VIGTLLGVALAMLPAHSAAQRAPASEDSAQAASSTDSLARAPRALPVVLATRLSIAPQLGKPLELRSGESDAAENIAFVRDSAASNKGWHMLLGMAIGTAAGGGLGYLAGKAWCDSHEDHGEGPPCEVGLPPLVALSAFLGLIAGGIIGAHAERELPGPQGYRMAIDAAPLGARGMAVAVTLH
jgi:hypothetical protein